jgi:hypothetical protein
MAMATGVVAFAILMTLLLGGLTVRVQQTHVLLHLGSAPVIRRRVSYGDIVSMRAVTYRPIRDFGGWGVRGWGKRQVWSARGNQAVELELQGGRRLWIGSDHPQRLEGRIRVGWGKR